jgi:hypothetical protein
MPGSDRWRRAAQASIARRIGVAGVPTAPGEWMRFFQDLQDRAVALIAPDPARHAAVT